MVLTSKAIKQKSARLYFLGIDCSSLNAFEIYAVLTSKNHVLNLLSWLVSQGRPHNCLSHSP